MTQPRPDTTYSVSNGADEVSAGELHSVEEVNDFLKQYALDHGHDEAMALTVWEMAPWWISGYSALGGCFHLALGSHPGAPAPLPPVWWPRAQARNRVRG